MSGQGSGRIIGAVVGAVAAYFTGGLSVVLTGAALGAAVGGAFDKGPNTQGPRIDDLKVQTSSYGVGIPIIYGTERFSGNVIWSTDKLEVPTTTSAGKGGSASNTNYRYYVHMRILLCETPRDGSTVSVLKILQDGKLIWDASSGIPLGSALASAENRYASFSLYQGRGDQLPEPGEESWEGGPGSVSAYHGVVSVRMNAVECPGGRVPQFSFVLTSSASAPEKSNFGETTTASAGFATADGVWSWTTTVANPPVVTLSLTPVGGVAKTIAQENLGLYYVTFGEPVAVVGAPSPQGLFAFGSQVSVGDEYDTVRVIDLKTGDYGEIYRVPYNGAATAIGKGTGVHAAYDTVQEKYAVTRGFTAPNTGMTIIPGGIECDTTDLDRVSPIAFYSNVIYVLGYTGTNMTIAMKSGTTGGHLGTASGPAISGVVLQYCTMQVDVNGITVRVQKSGVSQIYKVTIASLVGTWVAMPGTGDFINTTATAGVPASASMFTPSGAAFGPNFDGTWTYLRYVAVTPIQYKAKGIIVDQFQRSGTTTYDVSAVPDSDTVYGYKLAGPASARANIDPLLTCFGYFVVDEDGATKVKRYADITSVTNVSFDELGQVEAGNDPSDAMPLQHTQVLDLSRSVTVTYIDPTNDFQAASEVEVRQVTSSTEDQTVALPLCISSDQAKKAAQMVLYDQAKAQNTRSLTVSRKFAFVSPGDGVTIEYPRGTFRLWMVMSVNDTGAVCEWVVRPGDAAIYTQTATGATGYVSQQVDAIPALTRAQVLDMAITRDIDNNAGVYVALDSFANVPASAELRVGNADNDSSLVPVGSVSQSAPIGFAETVLAAAPSGMIDEKNLVTVNLGDDVFANCTRDVLLAGGGEYWAYGAPGRWEIGASALGSSLGSGRYTLSRHLRGLFGTEQYTGAHLSGDTFVLLRIPGLLRPSMSAGEVGQTKFYRAVTVGRSFDSVASVSYANTGEGMRPLSPINLRRTNTNDFTVDRRSRLAMNNYSGILPLGETTEAWSWEFYTSGAFTTLVGTVLTNTATVTAAQQTAIGVTPSATAFIKVRLISDSVGAGHELQASA